MKTRSLKLVLSAATSIAALSLGATGAEAQTLAPAQTSGAPATSPRGPALASAGTSEVVVTARRRAENIQNVPASVTAVSAVALAEQQINDQTELKFDVPSLSVENRYGHQGATYAIRGLAGSTASQPTVGTYFAEVPTPTNANGYDPSAGATFYDLDSVQVLKGPQGTLFGRTSVAGAVLVTPHRVDLNDYHGDIDVTAGSLGRAEVTGDINIPIIKDVLGVRVAYNRDHLDGYTNVIGTSEKLDETNTDAYRVSVEFKPTSWLHNTTIFDSYHVDEAPGSFVVTAYNPLLPSFSPTTAAFNGACATAVTYGLSPNLAACVAQHRAVAANVESQLAAEAANVAANGSYAIRNVPAGNAAYPVERLDHQTVVNTTAVDLPTFGAFDVSLKNIFGYQFTKGLTGASLSDTASPAYIQYFGVGAGASNNQIGNSANVNVGPGNNFYTDEFQLSGKILRDRFIWVIGYYYQDAPVTSNPSGVNVLSRTIGGVGTYNLGYVASVPFQIGGDAHEKASYGQATLSLDGLWEGYLDGLKLTAGGRHTADKSTLVTAAAVTNYATGVLSPSPTQTTSSVATSGDGYNLSIDYRSPLLHDLLVYAATRSGYVPGGLNAQANSAGLNNYEPQYGAERIRDIEIGAKYDIRLGDMRGRFDIDYYHANYTNMQRSYTGINTQGAVVIYTANAADSVLQGMEMEFSLRPVDHLLVAVNYSLNYTNYTQYIGADPLNVAPAGTVINLTDNPFPNAPRNKLNISSSYDYPLSDNRGILTLSGNLYLQSREWFASTPYRFLDIYGATTTDLADKTSQPTYYLVNSRLDWSRFMGHEGLSVGVFVKNLFDKTYAQGGLVSLSTLGQATKTFAEPRTYGVNMSYHF